MATVALSRSRGNLSPAIPGSQPLSAAVAHALAVGSRKPAAESRDSLEPGIYEIAETVRIIGVLTVAHDTETAASHTPDANTLVALVLAKLNGQTRAAICRDLAAEFVANGCEYPAVDESTLEMAENLTASLRRKVSQHRRGAVTGQFSIARLGVATPQALSVVG